MIRVTCHAARFRGGMKHEAGVAFYPDDQFSGEQLKTFQDDPDFEILLDCDESLQLRPESMTLDQAIRNAMTTLAPAAKDYGVDINALETDIRVVFAEADEIGAHDIGGGDEEFNKVVEACMTLLTEEPRDEDKFAGKRPKTSTLKDMVGFPVVGQVRDAAWKVATEGEV